MEDPNKLRALARWYREFSEKTQNPAIWDLRLRHAENLDAEAERIERALTAYSDQSPVMPEAPATVPGSYRRGVMVRG